MTVSPEQVTMIDVRKEMLAAAPELIDRTGSFGSVIYRFAGGSVGNIFGASMVQRNSSPIGFHFDQEPIESGSAVAKVNQAVQVLVGSAVTGSSPGHGSITNNSDITVNK